VAALSCPITHNAIGPSSFFLTVQQRLSGYDEQYQTLNKKDENMAMFSIQLGQKASLGKPLFVCKSQYN